MENMEKRQVEEWNDMENMEDFCVSHNYTQRNFLLLLPPSLPPTILLLLLPLCIVFFRIEKIHPGIVFC